MQKLTFIIFVVFFAIFGAAIIASAHADGSNRAHEVLGLPEPGLLPDSPIYFLKSFGRGIRLFFTFNSVKKAELNAHFADEKLAELAKLSEIKPNAADALGDALQNYIEAQQRLAVQLGSLKGTNKNVDALLDKLAGRVFDHEKLFDELEEKFAKEKVKEAEKEIGEAIKKALEIDGKKFKEKLKAKIKEDEDDNLEDLDVLEQLEELDEDLEEELKEMKEDLKREAKDLSGKAREEIREAREKIAELKEELAEAPESELRASTKKLLQNAEEKLQEAEKAFADGDFGQTFGLAHAAGRIAENAERQLEERDEVEDLDEDLAEEFEKLSEELEEDEKEIACIQLYDPVCGKDGKTYSNSCFAGLAKVDIAHKGECPNAPKSEVPSETRVTVDANGNFSPASVSVKKGGKVTWTNRGQNPVWPASALHPTHQLYPGFDAFRGISFGEEYSFKFDRLGVWKYHDHLNPPQTGTIEVVE